MNEVRFTLEQASHTMGVTPAKLERLIEEGKLPVVSDGIRRYVTREALLDYMRLVNAGRVRAGRAERTRGGREAPAAEA
jgi:excisionase family DNA binding protein